jgi:hypothetical protein
MKKNCKGCRRKSLAIIYDTIALFAWNHEAKSRKCIAIHDVLIAILFGHTANTSQMRHQLERTVWLIHAEDYVMKSHQSLN